MKRPLAIVGSALFLVVAPGTVAGVIPWWISHWRMETLPPSLAFVRVLGVLLIGAGLAVLLDSFARFAIQGLGTPAPIAPTRHLVVTGAYRHVRNPMYVAVVSLVVGQGLLLANRRVLTWGLACWVAFHLFVRLFEEPRLRAAFGAEYETFCANVSRWIPRLRPWRGNASASKPE